METDKNEGIKACAVVELTLAICYFGFAIWLSGASLGSIDPSTKALLGIGHLTSGIRTSWVAGYVVLGIIGMALSAGLFKAKRWAVATSMGFFAVSAALSLVELRSNNGLRLVAAFAELSCLAFLALHGATATTGAD